MVAGNMVELQSHSTDYHTMISASGSCSQTNADFRIALVVSQFAR